jgi:hypothetical protein
MGARKPAGWAPPPGFIVLTRIWDGAKVLVPLNTAGNSASPVPVSRALRPFKAPLRKEPKP